MTAGDVTTWNRIKVQANTPLYPLTGWSSPIAPAAGGIDITAPVREWIKGTKPNYGFVVTGVGEPACGCAPERAGLFQSSCSYKCITHFKPIMYVTFIEKPDPCGPQ